jgi:hypothetical protein
VPNYTWTSGAQTFTGTQVIFNPQATTVYTATGSDGTCTAMTTLTVTTNPNPTITSITTPSTTICLNNSVTLTGNTSALSPVTGYTWTTSTNTTPIASGAGANTVIVSPATPTAYVLTVENSFSCTSTATQVINVNLLPNVTASVVSNKTLVCSGGQTTLSAGGANTYSWTSGAGTATSLVNPLATTVYTVTGTATLTGCRNTKTVTVNVFTPTISIVGNTATCYGGSITLAGTSSTSPTSYTWNGNVFQATLITTPTTAAVYLLAAETTSSGVKCAATATVQIIIYVNPTVTALSTPSAVCRGETVTLTGSGATTYTYTDPTGATQTGPSVIQTLTAQTLYTVVGTDNNGCNDSTTVLVKASFCTGIGENSASSDLIYVYPNPNNGTFQIHSDVDVELNLINQVGQIVRRVKLSNSNDNRISIENLANGLYYLVGEKDGVRLNQKIIVNK